MKSVWFCVALAGAAALAACSGNDSPAVAPPTSPRAASAPQPESPDLRKRIEIAEVGYSTSHPALALSGKVAYGEDRYSKISSPLQGRILEVRARLGDYVKPGDVLLVIDSPEITAVYSDYVKEASELEYATRAYELAKDLYETKALPQKDLKQAENDLIKARAEFRRAKERLLSLRVPAAELEKPLAQQAARLPRADRLHRRVTAGAKLLHRHRCEDSGLVDFPHVGRLHPQVPVEGGDIERELRVGQLEARFIAIV